MTIHPNGTTITVDGWTASHSSNGRCFIVDNGEQFVIVPTVALAIRSGVGPSAYTNEDAIRVGRSYIEEEVDFILPHESWDAADRDANEYVAILDSL